MIVSNGKCGKAVKLVSNGCLSRGPYFGMFITLSCNLIEHFYSKNSQLKIILLKINLNIFQFSKTKQNKFKSYVRKTYLSLGIYSQLNTVKVADNK